jgi:hypothetical protein
VDSDGELDVEGDDNQELNAWTAGDDDLEAPRATRPWARRRAPVSTQPPSRRPVSSQAVTAPVSSQSAAPVRCDHGRGGSMAGNKEGSGVDVASKSRGAERARREKSGGGESRRLGCERSGDFYTFAFGLCWNDVLLFLLNTVGPTHAEAFFVHAQGRGDGQVVSKSAQSRIAKIQSEDGRIYHHAALKKMQSPATFVLNHLKNLFRNSSPCRRRPSPGHAHARSIAKGSSARPTPWMRARRRRSSSWPSSSTSTWRDTAPSSTATTCHRRRAQGRHGGLVPIAACAGVGIIVEDGGDGEEEDEELRRRRSRSRMRSSAISPSRATHRGGTQARRADDDELSPA